MSASDCAPVDGRRGAMAGLGRNIAPWVMLVWAPIVLIGPLTSGGPSWLGWLTAAAVTVLSYLVVLASVVPALSRRHVAQLLLVALAAVTVAATAGLPPHWFSLYGLLAIGIGAVVRSLRAPALVVLTAAGGGAMVLYRGGSWADAGWGIALTTFLAGACTYGFVRLGAVIAELNSTREELARAAVWQERQRFSRDLHDLLGHTLSVIVVKAEVVRRLAATDPDAAAEHAADIETTGRRALAEVRQAVTGYREASLAAELDRAGTTLAAAGIDVSIANTGGALPPATDAVLGWVVREAVTNVVRHSGADRCAIEVRRDGGIARLEVVDDGGRAGHGAGAVAEGSGLSGLRERVRGAGGRLEAAALPTGFRLAAEIPVSVEAHRPAEVSRR